KSNTRLIAVGGGLAAGMQNGGLYRAGQLSSFPSLVARQLGADCIQPLFSEAKGNGSGFRLIHQTTPWVTYKTVRNQLAWDGGKLEQFRGKFDNYAFPGFSRRMRHPRDLPGEARPYLDRLLQEEDVQRKVSVMDW